MNDSNSRANALNEPAQPVPGPNSNPEAHSNNMAQVYWRANLKVLAVLLSVWFVVSYGFGILWVDWLDQFQFFGFKLGFWFAQQGSIFVFVLLILIYALWMQRLERKLGFSDEEG